MVDRYADALSRLLELVVVLNDDMTRHLAGTGLTVPRATLIWELQHRGPSPQRVLAEALGVSPRTITGLVDGLVETGYVTREPHPGDRRAVAVTLTAQGRAVAEAFVAGRAELGRRLFAHLPAQRFAHFDRTVAEIVTTLREETA